MRRNSDVPELAEYQRALFITMASVAHRDLPGLGPYALEWEGKTWRVDGYVKERPSPQRYVLFASRMEEVYP